MNWEIWAALLPVIAGIVGVWVNLNSTVARLKKQGYAVGNNTRRIQADRKRVTCQHSQD